MAPPVPGNISGMLRPACGRVLDSSPTYSVSRDVLWRVWSHEVGRVAGCASVKCKRFVRIKARGLALQECGIAADGSDQVSCPSIWSSASGSSHWGNARMGAIAPSTHGAWPWRMADFTWMLLNGLHIAGV